MSYPNVFIIILNWNGLKDTLECLDSVYRLDYPNFEVIVVDNCSSDGSVGMIQRKFSQVAIIENSKNLGYTGGNNIGMRRALELGADYVWLLNNDTIVEPDTLTKIVDEAELAPEIGLVSPVVRYYDNPDVIQFMGAYVVIGKYEVALFKDSKELDNERVQRNLVLFGTALLVKRRVIETIGYLPEKYFAYYEDYEYSLRALRNNFRTKVRFDARIFHKDSRSTGKDSPIKVVLRTRNTYYLWWDNEQGFRRILVTGRYLGMMIGYAKYLSDEGNEKSYDACQNGVWAALTGKGGAYDPCCVMPSVLKTVFNFFVSWHPYFWADLFTFNIRGMAMGFCKKFNRPQP